jgi:hypothetical protein
LGSGPEEDWKLEQRENSEGETHVEGAMGLLMLEL